MDNQERHLLVSTLKSKINIVNEEIKLKKLELEELNKKMWDAKMIKFSWDELMEWLIENRPKNDYKKNPIVSNGTHMTYCCIEEGELRVGMAGGDDRFRRGCDLFVPYNFPSWGN